MSTTPSMETDTSCELTPPIDWHVYNAQAAGRPARRMVQRAIAAAGGDGPGRVALEIGAGGGADTLEFARHGWTVHAYDSDDTLVSRLVEKGRLPGRIRFHHTDAARVRTFPVAHVVYSAYSLPMLGDALPATWARLRDALNPGGVMAVDLFGEADTWAARPDIATCAQDEIREMFAGLQIVDRSVRDEDGRSFHEGRKHWHVVSTIARAPRAPRG